MKVIKLIKVLNERINKKINVFQYKDKLRKEIL